MSETEPVRLYVDGSFAILCTGPDLMRDMLAQRTLSAPSATPAQLIAGFRHDQEHSSFRRLTGELGYTDSQANPARSDSFSPDGPAPIDLFRDNVPTLSDTALASERLIERRDGTLIHQTVTYTWNPMQR